MCQCLMLHGSQPDSDENVMNTEKRGIKGVSTDLFFADSSRVEGKTSGRRVVDTTLECLL